MSVIGDNLVIVRIERVEAKIEYRMSLSYHQFEDRRFPALVGLIRRRYIQRKTETKPLPRPYLLHCLQCVLFGEIIPPSELFFGAKLTPVRYRWTILQILRHLSARYGEGVRP